MEYYSLTDIKKKNLSDVFHYIYSTPGTSKQGIANALSLSLPTVSQNLNLLLEEGLIEKSGQLSSSIGRKAAAYQIVATARIAIGIEILSNKIYIVGINLLGQKEAKEKAELKFQPNDTYFEALKELILSFLERHSFKEEQILGIGLGIQGLTSQDGETVTYGKILDCTGFSISGLQKYFPFPCRFLHDAECAAASELWENPEIQDCLYLSLGYHLGGAVILDGRLQQGITGKSGTFEHMTLIPGGKTCYCGKIGCAECYCSASALLADSGLELEDFFSQKSQGITQYQKSWERYLDNLSLLINNLHMVMDNVVILGGHITPYFTDEDVSALRERVEKLSSFQDSSSYILPGRCRNDAVSIGAALPFIKDYLENLASETNA